MHHRISVKSAGLPASRRKIQLWCEMLVVCAGFVLTPTIATAQTEDSATAGEDVESAATELPVGPSAQRSARATMRTFLSSVNNGRWDAATLCLDFSEIDPSPNADTRQRMATELKAIIDRMAWVDLRSINDDPTGELYRFPPGDNVQPIVVERGNDDAWRFGSATVGRIESLYADYKDRDPIVTETPWYRRMTPLGNEVWRIAALFLAILIGLVLGKVVQSVMASIGEHLSNRGQQYPAAVMRALSRTAVPAMAVVGLQAGLAFLIMVPVVEEIAVTITSVLYAIIVAYAAYALVDVVDTMMQNFADKTESKLDDMLVPMVRTSLRTTIIVLALVQVGTILSDKPMTSIIAGLGVGGLAIGLASQDMVKNFFGSIMILSDHPFEIGDFIEVGSHKGSVESVGFRSTRLRTPDGHVVTIPNGGLANESIVNLSRRPFLKRSFGLGLTYDTSPDNVQRAIEIVREILDNHAGMDAEKPPLVNFNEFTDSTLNIQVTYWHFPPEWSDFRALNDHVNSEVLRRFNDEGIEMAFPTQTIYQKVE